MAYARFRQVHYGCALNNNTANTLTFENVRNTAFEIDKGRIIMNTILFGNWKVFRFDKCDAMSIAVVVDIFQLFENFRALFAIVYILLPHEFIRNYVKY